MYLFIITSVTITINLVLKNLFYSFEGHNFLKWISLGYEQGVGRAPFLLGGFKGEPVFLPFLASGGCPHSSVGGSLLSSKPVMAGPRLFHHGSLLTTDSSLPLPYRRTVLITLGPPR